MKKLPVGIQTFRKIVEGGYVYVDKTRYVYDMLTTEPYYFLSRPRRFGKSLLLDTLCEAFSGDKELFKGTYLYDSGYNFDKHPVLRLDMNRMSNGSPKILQRSITLFLTQRIKAEGMNVIGETPSDVFQTMIEGLYNKYGKPVVVLIDEYDKPILDHLTDLETAIGNRDVLREFYGVLKSMDPYLRFVFITRITKLAKTSIFSALNNPRDITMSRRYANICGIPTDELEKYFGDRIEYLSTLDEFTRFESVRDKILEWYDGYSWDGRTRVINPFALLSFFSEERFAGFWYATGTPKFLTDMLKRDPGIYSGLKNATIAEHVLDAGELDSLEAEPLMFQTGYLTIKEVIKNSDVDEYMLDIPNNEVRQAFNMHVLAAFTGKS